MTEIRDAGHSFVTRDKGLPQGPASGNLWVSSDGGTSWQHLGAHLPPIAALAFAP